ncbi:MAG: sulfatase-like hydrolase/transferase [Planctomycetaceae bacterium]|nr:sulfatase-like hydrolase/transferase [Planctomycetaceae bacterium]
MTSRLASLAGLLLCLSPFALVAAEPAPPAGFRAIFNGRDLAGWYGLNPHAVVKLEGEKRDANLQKQREEFAQHWNIENGELVNVGTGPYATTEEEFGDIEFLIDYKTVAKADSGIYLRGTPQVQIWDFSKEGGKWDRNADKGSGGLFNNAKGAPGQLPLALADKPFGEWNAFRIQQAGRRTWVWLNDKLVVDGAVMENYWDRAQPLPAKGPIMLQTHGGEIRWRNLFVRNIPVDEATKLVAKADAIDRARKPNVLIIVGDDMGYADVGFHGCKDIPTPNLDKLAKGGVRFTNGYVTGPYCSPTRAGLLTGRYQQRFGHEFNPAGGTAGLPTTETTLADRLKAAGYATALVGKWHLGSEPELHPQQRGFQEFFGFLGGAHDYFVDAGLQRGREPVSEPDYLTDAIGRESSAFIQRNQGQPWFLAVTFNAVHTPMQAGEFRLEKFASIADKTRRTYAAMMSAMDDAVGRVIQSIENTGQSQSTLVVFISDNGGPTMPGVTVNGSINAPLRGSKRTTLEGGIRVPFVVSWPGRVKPGVFEAPVIQLDAHATALAAAGVTADKLDGVDLLPYLTGTKTGAPHDALFWRFGEQMAVRQGSFKLVKYDLNADTLTGKNNQGATAAKLYDLSQDIGETTDLAATMPDKVRELQARWDVWNKDNVAPLWGGGGSGQRKNKKAQAAN